MTPETWQGLVVYTLNSLFDLVLISLQHLYNPYDRPGIPLELSPQTSSVVRHRLFPPMESKGEIPVSSPGHSEVSATHTPHVFDDQGYQFLLEGFPYMGSIPTSIYPEEVIRL